ncbi:MAG: hypothetical protein IIC73_07495 [Armatimonadetes bacterium]|nr:hypothetical protein [Armatimonadota bacterium]
MDQRPVEIVSVNVGGKFPDVYVQRLYSMLGRNFGRPFRFTCFTDRKRNLSSEICQIDIGHWNERGFFNKMVLYNDEEMPYDAALYLDITMVIKDDITHLVDYAASLDADLVVIRDWKYPAMNSCVQWITKNDTMRAVWDVYTSGHFPEFRTRGDQEFTFDALKALGLENRLGYFPDGEVQSYKVLRSANRNSAAEARRLLEASKIVKFHGTPRQHEVIHPWLRISKVAMKYPHYAAKDWNFLVREIREWWQ